MLYYNIGLYKHWNVVEKNSTSISAKFNVINQMFKILSYYSQKIQPKRQQKQNYFPVYDIFIS